MFHVKSQGRQTCIGLRVGCMHSAMPCVSFRAGRAHVLCCTAIPILLFCASLEHTVEWSLPVTAS